MPYPFRPDWTIPPGDSILEWLEANNRTQAWLAERIKRPLSQVNRLINGRIALTARWALELEKATKIPATLWMGLESNHRLFIERKKRK